MSAQYQAALDAAHQKMPVESKRSLRIEKAKRVPFSEADWDFESVPADEVGACLIYEYGRAAYRKIYRRLPDYKSKNISSQHGRFFQLDPPPALKYLNALLGLQWDYSPAKPGKSSKAITRRIYFPFVPWRRLPPLVRTNMWRRLRGLPLVADLRVIHENLTEGEGQSTATDWSRDIAKLNEFFKQSREAKVDNGQRTFVLTLNWNLGEPDLIEKFKSEILPLRPHEFRDKARWKRKETRNLKGIELKRKGKPVLLRTALSALGTLRCMKKARNHRDFMEQFRPEELRIAERASLSIEDASRVYRGQKADAEEYLNQLFPGP